MLLELYKSFIVNKLETKQFVEAMYTEIGSDLYAYMVMLGAAGRSREAAIFEGFRTRIFEARGKWHSKGETSSQEMRIIYSELNTIWEMLKIYQPKESGILQSPCNELLGFIWLLEEFDKEKAMV